MELFEMIDEYKELLDKKDDLKALSVENNKEIEKLRNELAQAMIDEECPKVSRNGFTYSLQDKTKYNKKACNEDEFFECLETNGLGDIIKRTVSAQTLSGAMSQLVEDNDGQLPEDFEPYISVYEFYDISKRKETNRAAAKAKNNVKG